MRSARSIVRIWNRKNSMNLEFYFPSAKWQAIIIIPADANTIPSNNKH